MENWIDPKQQEMFNWTRFSFLLWSYLWKGWNVPRSQENTGKCSIGQDSVSFFGVIFVKDRMYPDPKKIQGILEMPPPKATTQLQSFLGMVNFMHNFIPHLSEHTATLRGLLTKNAVFHWDESTNAAFQKLKSLIAEVQKRSLKFYNRNLPLTVQADASKHGLGAALLQQGEPVAFASKSLSETEQRYALRGNS